MTLDETREHARHVRYLADLLEKATEVIEQLQEDKAEFQAKLEEGDDAETYDSK